MSRIRKRETGVPGLDTVTHGGIPEGRSTLIAGRSGTGKTVVALQIAAHAASQDMPVAILGVEEEPDDLRDTGDALNMRLTEHMKNGRVVIEDFTRPQNGPTLVSGEYDMYALIHRVEGLIKQSPRRVSN